MSASRIREDLETKRQKTVNKGAHRSVLAFFSLPILAGVTIFACNKDAVNPDQLPEAIHLQSEMLTRTVYGIGSLSVSEGANIRYIPQVMDLQSEGMTSVSYTTKSDFTLTMPASVPVSFCNPDGPWVGLDQTTLELNPEAPKKLSNAVSQDKTKTVWVSLNQEAGAAAVLDQTRQAMNLEAWRNC